MKCIVRSLLIATVCLGMASIQTFGISNEGIRSGHKKDPLKKFSVTLGAQSNSSIGGLLDVSNGKVLQLFEAAGRQKSVDIIYVYGRNTKANILTPASSRIKSFGKNLRNKMAGVWSVFNKGYLVNIRHGKQARKLYRKTKTRAQLVAAYKESRRMVKTFLDYKSLVNGPTLSIRQVEPGDIIVFRSSDKDLYAIAKVVDYTSGYQGSITLDFKVAARD